MMKELLIRLYWLLRVHQSTDDGDTSPTETTDSKSPTGTTESTLTTEETPVTDQMPFGMQSSTTRYPSREH